MLSTLFGVERSISFSFAQSRGAILSVIAVHGLQPDNVPLQMAWSVDGVPPRYWWLPNALIIALVLSLPHHPFRGDQHWGSLYGVNNITTIC